MVERINNIPRADTQIANSSTTKLWEFSSKDIVIEKAKVEISSILNDNITVTSKAI